MENGNNNDYLVNDPAVRYQRASAGITKSDFLAIVAETGLTLTAFSALLPVTRRTIEKAKESDLLSPVVSDRVLQLSALYQHGAEVMGSKASFNKWLQTPLIALGGEKPYRFINNGTGIAMINDLLGRIEHGVYS